MSREELLILLIEECGEVVQAATKCLRFGFEHDEPGYGRNDFKLADELGDLLGVVTALPIDNDRMFKASNTKLARAIEASRLRRAASPPTVGGGDA